MSDRNQICPCGSGQKYKKCCADKDKKKAQFPAGLIVLIAGIVVAVAVGFAPRLMKSDTPETAAAPVATAATAPSAMAPSGAAPATPQAAVQPVAQPGSPQPEGVAPAGKVWSVEHGHWHDAPAANPAIQIQSQPLPGGMVATTGDRPARGTPPEPGATWSEEHGHWHKAGTNIAVGATPSGAKGVNPATGAPIGADPAPQAPGQVRAFGELVDLTPKPGTPAPGPAPEGMEWSVEHGHWHPKQQ